MIAKMSQVQFIRALLLKKKNFKKQKSCKTKSDKEEQLKKRDWQKSRKRTESELLRI